MIKLNVQNVLFGTHRGWKAEEWTDSDDRVRGGISQSYMKVEHAFAIFCGSLDTTALGGAGFASQRTTGDDRHWDLTSSTGIQLSIDASNSDSKKYAFILKDKLLPRDPENGREQSTISWEYEFQVPKASDPSRTSEIVTIYIPWNDLKPTYRGREQVPKEPLNVADIRRMSIMMRSFFGSQEGDFELRLCRIAAVSEAANDTLVESIDTGTSMDSGRESLDEKTYPAQQTSTSSLFSQLSKCFGM